VEVRGTCLASKPQNLILSPPNLQSTLGRWGSPSRPAGEGWWEFICRLADAAEPVGGRGQGQVQEFGDGGSRRHIRVSNDRRCHLGAEAVAACGDAVGKCHFTERLRSSDASSRAFATQTGGRASPRSACRVSGWLVAAIAALLHTAYRLSVGFDGRAASHSATHAAASVCTL
jgi:hypothetical protein